MIEIQVTIYQLVTGGANYGKIDHGVKIRKMLFLIFKMEKKIIASHTWNLPLVRGGSPP